MPLQEKERGAPVSQIRSWLLGRKTKQPKVVDGTTITHYGSTSSDLDTYCEEFRRGNGPESDPMEAPVDARAVLRAGKGKKHGRYKTMNSFVETDETYPQVRSDISGGGGYTPRPARRVPPTVSFFSFSSSFSSFVFAMLC